MHSYRLIVRGLLAAGLLLGLWSGAANAANRDLNAQTDCGAVGNGVANDTAALQSCINTSATTKQAIYLPVGHYRITATLNISASNTTIYGTDSANTIIVQDTPSAYIFHVVNGSAPVDRLTFRRLNLYYSVNHPTGIAVVCENCWRTYFQQVNFGSAAAGAYLSSGLWVTGGNQVFVEDSTVTNDTSQGMYFTDVGDVFLSNVEVNQLDNDTGSTGIIFDSGVGGVYATNVNVTAGETAFLFENTKGTVPPNFGFFTNCLADTTNGFGWYFQAATSMRLTNSWAATAADTGIIVFNVNGLSITDSRIYNNGGYGILLNAGAQNVTIKDSTITGNSRLAAGTKPGIYVTGGIGNFQILNNKIGPADGFSNLQSYAVVVAAGASDYYVMTGNDTHGNVTGGVQDGGSGTHKLTSPNL